MRKHNKQYYVLQFFKDLWYVEDTKVWLPIEKISKDKEFSDCLKCKSVRAFRRRLKEMSKQPELLGKTVYLCSLNFEDDTIKMKVKKSNKNFNK